MTGVFFRVNRNGKFINVELEHLTNQERSEILSSEKLLDALNVACDKLAEIEPIFNGLVEDGVLNTFEAGGTPDNK